jgi:hypothetical protein
MIDIQIAGEFLDMSPGQQLSLNIANPLFADEIGYQSHSYKFAVPATAHNQRLLGYANLALLADAPASFEAQLWLGGMPWLKGTVQLTNVTDTTFSLAFEQDASYRDLIENTFIKDLPLEQVVVPPVGAPMEMVLTIDLTGVSGDKAALFIYDTLVWTPFIAGMSEFNVLSNLENVIINSGIPVTPQVVTGGAKDELHLTPTDPDIFFVDTDPAENDHTWNVISYRSSYDANRISVGAHLGTVGRAAPGDYNYAFPPIKNALFYGDDPGDYIGYVNLFDPATQTFPVNSDATGENCRTAICPQVSVKHVWETVCEFLGLTDVSTWTGSTDFEKLYLYSNRAIERIFQGVAYIASTWDLADHVPQDWTIEYFFNFLRQFNVAIHIDSVTREIELVERKEIKRSENTDLRDQSLVGHSLSFAPSTAAYGYEYIQDKSDALYEDVAAFGAITGEEENRKVKAPVAPLFEAKSLDPTQLQEWLTPAIEQQGYTSAKGLTPNEVEPRFFFYLGLHANADGYDYPVAGSTGQDYDGNQISTFSLHWDGADGLYAYAYERAEPWLFAGREISIPMQISVDQVLSLAWNKTIFIRLPEGEIPVFWKQLKVSVSRERIESAQLEGKL